MFCPACGREDSQGRRFCPTCGANLEKVTRALSPGGDSLLARADQAFDRLIGRYAGLFFGAAREKALDWRMSHSWTLWAQAFLALPANFILFWIMLFGILPLRLVTLLLGSPFRLLSERSNQQDAAPEAKVGNRRAQLQAPPPGQWVIDSGPSAVEHTTMNLPDSPATERKRSRS
ncbi:MAG: zinc ribbon domain-containing protein [Blastocatellia bacterium]